MERTSGWWSEPAAAANTTSAIPGGTSASSALTLMHVSVQRHGDSNEGLKLASSNNNSTALPSSALQTACGAHNCSLGALGEMVVCQATSRACCTLATKVRSIQTVLSCWRVCLHVQSNLNAIARCAAQHVRAAVSLPRTRHDRRSTTQRGRSAAHAQLPERPPPRPPPPPRPLPLMGFPSACHNVHDYADATVHGRVNALQTTDLTKACLQATRACHSQNG